MTSLWSKLVSRALRRRVYSATATSTQLARTLGTLDLTMLGVASMLGAGIFTLTGTLVSQVAGPAGALSYLLAGIAAILVAGCYMELGAILPHAGSVYVYTYFAVGELPAFIVGWTLISVPLVAVPAVAKAFSAALDSLFSSAISNWEIIVFGKWSVSYLDKTPDLVACAVVLISYTITMIGVKGTSLFNIIVNAIEVLLLTIIIAFSFVYGSVSNWSNFFPFGVTGVFAGTAICTFAFGGFDVVANAAEETRDPRRSIPIAIGAALGILGVLYVLATLGLSYLQPYYLVSTTRPFIDAFGYVNQTVVKVFAIIATLAATSLTKIALAFVGPRLLYALGRDRLIFPVCGYVSECNQIPILPTLLLAVLSALLALFSSLSSLAEVSSLGYLIAYVAVGVCLLIIRIEHLETSQSPRSNQHSFREAHCLLTHNSSKATAHYTLESDDPSKPILSLDPTASNYDPLDATTNPDIYPRVKPAWVRFYPLKMCTSPASLRCTLYIVLTVLVLFSALLSLVGVNASGLVSSVFGTIVLYVLVAVIILVIVVCVALLCFFDGDPTRHQVAAVSNRTESAAVANGSSSNQSEERASDGPTARKRGTEWFLNGTANKENRAQEAGDAAEADMDHTEKSEQPTDQSRQDLVDVEIDARVFRVPLMPLVPALAIVINGGLIFTLDATSWIRFLVWLIVGLLVYVLSAAFVPELEPSEELETEHEIAERRRTRSRGEHEETNSLKIRTP